MFVSSNSVLDAIQNTGYAPQRTLSHLKRTQNKLDYPQAGVVKYNGWVNRDVAKNASSKDTGSQFKYSLAHKSRLLKTKINQKEIAVLMGGKGQQEEAWVLIQVGGWMLVCQSRPSAF